MIDGERSGNSSTQCQGSQGFLEQHLDNPCRYDTNMDWLKEVRMESYALNKDTLLLITEMGCNACKRMSLWKALGPYGVQVKKFTSLDEWIAQQLYQLIKTSQVPVWMTCGRMVLIAKNATKSNISSNYRPITCLPIMRKLLASALSESII